MPTPQGESWLEAPYSRHWWLSQDEQFTIVKTSALVVEKRWISLRTSGWSQIRTKTRQKKTTIRDRKRFWNETDMGLNFIRTTFCYLPVKSIFLRLDIYLPTYNNFHLEKTYIEKHVISISKLINEFVPYRL